MAGGFRPVGNLYGGDYTGDVITYFVNDGHATLLAVGDLVQLDGQARAIDGMQEVDAAAAGLLVAGCITAIDPNISNLEQVGLPALTEGTIKVAVAKNMLLRAPSSAAITLADVGLNVDIVATAATTSGGLVNSNMTLATTFTTATNVMRVVGIPDGVLTSGADVFVTINETSLDTVGV